MDETLPLTFTVDETMSPEKFPLDAFFRFNHKLPYRWFICNDSETQDWQYITAPPNYRAQDSDNPVYQMYKQYYNSSFVLQEFHKLVTEARLNKNYQYSDGKQMIQPLPSSTSIEGYELLLDSATAMNSKLTAIKDCISRCRQARKAVNLRQKSIDEHVGLLLKYRRVVPLLFELKFLQLALSIEAILSLSSELGKYLRCKYPAVRICLPSSTIPLTHSLYNSESGCCDATHKYLQSCNAAAAFNYLQRYFIHSMSLGDRSDLNEVTITIDPTKKLYCTIRLVNEYAPIKEPNKNKGKVDTRCQYIPSDIELSMSEESNDAEYHNEKHDVLPDLSFMQDTMRLDFAVPHSAQGVLNAKLISGVLKLAHIREENPIALISDLLNVYKSCEQKLRLGDKVVLDASAPHRMTMTNSKGTYTIYSKDGVLYEQL